MTRARKQAGRITFVGAGPGDPVLLTIAAMDAIRKADICFVDSHTPPALTDLIAGETRAVDEVPTEMAKLLVAEARAGLSIVRLINGDVLADESALKEVQAISRTTVPFDVVPGISLGAGTASYAGVPVGPVHTEVVITDVSATDFEALAHAPGLLVVTATAIDVPVVGEQLVANGMKPDTPVTVSCDGTQTGQQTVLGTLGELDLAAAGMTGNLVVIIGKATASRDKMAWWESRPLYGWRVLVPRTKDQAGEMSERLRQYGAVPVEVPTIAVEPPRTPTQMERAIKGLVTGRYEWIVFTSTNAVRAVRELSLIHI